MKPFLISFAEGVIVGVFIIIVINILGIEATGTQLGILIASTLIFTSIGSSVSRAILKGEAPHKYEWIYTYDGNRIVVMAGLAEELYINDKLVDKKKGISLKAELNGRLKTGEEVKVVIIGGMTAKCELFIDDERVEPIAAKTP